MKLYLTRECSFLIYQHHLCDGTLSKISFNILLAVALSISVSKFLFQSAHLVSDVFWCHHPPHYSSSLLVSHNFLQCLTAYWIAMFRSGISSGDVPLKFPQQPQPWDLCFPTVLWFQQVLPCTPAISSSTPINIHSNCFYVSTYAINCSNHLIQQTLEFFNFHLLSTFTCTGTSSTCHRRHLDIAFSSSFTRIFNFN